MRRLFLASAVEYARRALMKVLRHNRVIEEFGPPYTRRAKAQTQPAIVAPPPRTPDEELLQRCLEYLVDQLGAVDGPLVEDLKARLDPPPASAARGG